MPVEDIDYLEAFGILVDNKITREGFIVKAKTDLTGELTVYDADKPSAGKSFIAPNVGVSIYNREGKLLANYGGKPSFSILKGALVYGALISGIVLGIKGLKGFIK